MSDSFAIVGIGELRPLLDRARVIAAVREALIWQSQGKVQSPLPGQLLPASARRGPGSPFVNFGLFRTASLRTQRAPLGCALRLATGFPGLPTDH